MRIDYPRGGRTGTRRYLPSWRQWLLLVLLGAGLLLGTFVVLYATIQVPQPNDAALQQASVVYYADGRNAIGRFGETNRTSIPFADMPESLRHAVLAAEDRRFYEHGGFSLTGIARAGWNDLLGGSVQGGSTITQQLVKNFYLTQERTLSRKVDEFIVSVKIEQQLPKDQILADYLNTIYFGRGAYGVQAAARAYFHQDARALSPSQGAVLASLIRSPAGYSPERHLDRLRERWASVLDGEVQEGWLTPAQRAAAGFPTIAPRVSGGLSGPGGYLVAYVKSELATHGITEEDLARGGLKVYTSIDRKAEAQAVSAVQAERPRTSASGVRVGLASVDPSNGTIVAMYGGPDYGHPQYLNDATQSIAQAGSTFKAFTLAAAFESGITLDSTWDGRSGRVFTDAQGTRTRPIANEDHKSYGRISLLKATEQSVNTVFVDVENQPQVGAAKVVEAARRAGIPDPVAIDPSLSATLGVASPTALDMASAYGTFASGGMRSSPTAVVRVVGSNGGTRYQLRAKPSRAFSQDVSAQVDVALQHVVTDGTGRKARDVGRPVAAKTGTTDSNLSAWFVGYNPQLSTAVVLFRTEPDGQTRRSLAGVGGAARVNGGSYPAAIWTAYMKAALDGRKRVDFPVPSTLPTSTATPSPSSTPTPTPTPTPSHSPTPTPTPTPSPSHTPSSSPTPSPSSSPGGAGVPSPAVPVTPVAPDRGGAGPPGILAPGDRRP